MTAMLAPLKTNTSAPALSVVIASVNGWDVLGATLSSLDALPERSRMEVIVVEAVGGTTRDRVRAHYPSVRLIEARERMPIPRLRFLGVQSANGDLVAILEDHADVDRGWAAALLDMHRGPWGAVGGAVENGRSGYVNWAVFFCEYTTYMGPVPEGACNDLPGNNIAYKRADLLRHAHVLDEGKWESWINDRLRAEGVEIASTNRAVVRHIKPFRLGYFLTQRFHFARSYAGMRRVDQTWAKRLVYSAGSLVLPALLLARATRTAIGKRRHLGRFFACLPLISLFLTVGALGEMIGYVIGPGRSLEFVE
ncbi:MAG: glycosyl transferase [Planctomycetota bacterium]|nr:glycosyl transferase [Planctomycetota bacterium]